MRKVKNIIIAGVAAIAITASSFAGVYAADPVVAEYKGGNISSNPGVFRITRKVTNVTNPVTNTFTYTIAAASGNPGTATGFPTSATIVMNNVAVSSNVATGTADISFKTTTFSELGDYYFTVTETASSNATNYPRDTHTYRIVASVRNELDGNNVPTDKYVVTIAANSVDSNDNKGDASGVNAFTSASSRTYIEVSQSVSGGMAKKSDCFVYTVSIPAVASVAAAGDAYTVNSNSTCTGSSATITVGGSSNKIAMKHGDTVTIGKNGTTSQMPIGVSYTIALDDAKGYQGTYFDEVASTNRTMAAKTTVAQNDSNFNAKNKTAIRNDKYMDPNTGLSIELWPFIVLILVAGVGAFVIVNKKAKKTTE